MSDNAWYRLKEYSTRDTQYDSDSRMFPLDSVVRVVECREKKNDWFIAVTLEGHPDLIDLIDRCSYMRYYFLVRLQPIDDLEVFRLQVERSKRDDPMV